MDAPKIEEKIKGDNLIFLQINDIRMAIQAGRTGDIELEGLYILIPDDLLKSINEDIQKTDEVHLKHIHDLKESWTRQVGHPSNDKFIIEMTPRRQAAINWILTLSTQKKLKIIINMLYKSGYYFTSKNSMPSSLVNSGR